MMEDVIKLTSIRLIYKNLNTKIRSVIHQFHVTASNLVIDPLALLDLLDEIKEKAREIREGLDAIDEIHRTLMNDIPSAEPQLEQLEERVQLIKDTVAKYDKVEQSLKEMNDAVSLYTKSAGFIVYSSFAGLLVFGYLFRRAFSVLFFDVSPLF